MRRATSLLVLLLLLPGYVHAQSFLGLSAPGGHLYFNFFQGEYFPGGHELFLLDETGARVRSIRTVNIPNGTFGPIFADLGEFATGQMFGFEWFYYGAGYTDRYPDIVAGDLASDSVFLRSEAGGVIYYSISSGAARPSFQVPPTPVSEPVSMALLGTGLLGIGVARRLRRQYS